MSNGDLKSGPHHIDNNHWWYEESGGIAVLSRLIEAGTSTTEIKWSAIRAALKRKDKKLKGKA